MTIFLKANIVVAVFEKQDTIQGSEVVHFAHGEVTVQYRRFIVDSQKFLLRKTPNAVQHAIELGIIIHLLQSRKCTGDYAEINSIRHRHRQPLVLS